MAELGRTTPGRKWVEQPLEMPRVAGAGKTRAPAVTTMALTMQMPSLSLAGAAVAASTVVADAGKVSAGKAAAAPLTPVAGLRLASAR